MCISTNTTYTDSISYYWDVTIDDIVKIYEGNLPAANNVKWSLFDGKKDGVFVTFQKDRRQLCKHWNSVIAMHTQIFQSSKKLQLRFENSNILVMFLRCTLRSETIFGSWKLFKNDEKGFLFHVNSSFCSQDMQVFALTFWSCSKTAS